MTQVVIQPSYGNRDARQHWQDTLAQEVTFSGPPYVQALSGPELESLTLLHPTGRARFWGATGNHDARMAKLSMGDVVLFTGNKSVRAIGEVGFSFRNSAFADFLWSPHADRGSYHNVYSLLQFQPTAIPYQEIWDLPGFHEGDNFMGLRFLDEDKSAVILAGLGIATATSAFREAATDDAVAAAVATGAVVPVEAVNTVTTMVELPARQTLVTRAEALLVAAYRKSLPPDANVGRTRTAAGITDLYIETGGTAEIVEAKRGAAHSFVREALGQLLDYALHSPHPVERLTALFPTRPSDSDIGLLHRYGIDCVYREPTGTFTRDPATDGQRNLLLGILHAAGAS